jgi:hypothetical protein
MKLRSVHHADKSPSGDLLWRFQDLERFSGKSTTRPRCVIGAKGISQQVSARRLRTGFSHQRLFPPHSRTTLPTWAFFAMLNVENTSALGDARGGRLGRCQDRLPGSTARTATIWLRSLRHCPGEREVGRYRRCRKRVRDFCGHMERCRSGSRAADSRSKLSC